MVGIEARRVGAYRIDDDETTPRLSHGVDGNGERIRQKSCTVSVLLKRLVKSEPSEKDRRDRIGPASSDGGRHLFPTNQMRRQREVGDDPVGLVEPHIGSSAAGSIRVKRVVLEPEIERGVSAGEVAQVMIWPEPLVEEHTPSAPLDRPSSARGSFAEWGDRRVFVECRQK